MTAGVTGRKKKCVQHCLMYDALALDEYNSTSASSKQFEDSIQLANGS